MNRQGEVVLCDELGRERERYGLQYGAKLFVKESDKVKGGQLLAEWDPYAMPIVTEVGGYVAYGDIVDGVTMQETLDEVTAMSRKTVIESKDADSRPRIALRDEAGESVKVPGSDNEAKYFLPVGANIFVNDGDFVEAGDVVAKIPRETTKTKDITAVAARGGTVRGACPRIARSSESTARCTSARTPRASARSSSSPRSVTRPST
jgi:DNA-directed RNA polymerase subunit beta'